jgi:hypothetical protein
LKILVIEDNLANVMAAKKGLCNHEVTVIHSLNEAAKLFQKYCYEDWRVNEFKTFPFEVVLTDVNMPFDLPAKRDEQFYDGCVGDRPESMPAGLIFALCAANLGAKVGILTDQDHHQSWLSALLDLISFDGHPEKWQIQVFRTPYPKNWSGALKKLMGEVKERSYYVSSYDFEKGGEQ